MSATAYHFWSPTCGPCLKIKPAIHDLQEDFPNVQWVSVNTHADSHGYSEKFGVRVVPTIVVVAGGKQWSASGTNMAEYHRILRTASKPF